MKRLNRAVVSVLWATVFLADVQACPAAGDSLSSTIEVRLVEVEARLFERPEGKIVVGLNMTNKPQKGVRISLPKATGTAWHVLIEARQVAEREDALVDDFEPYTVHVYSTAVLDQGLPTMGEIAQKFKEGRRAPQP